MRVCKAFLTVLFVLFGGSTLGNTLPLYAQEEGSPGPGNTAVLIDGTVLLGNARWLGDRSEWSRISSSRGVFPGIEVRFNQNKRTTIGLGYQRWQKLVNASSPEETYLMEFSECGDQRTIGGCPKQYARTITLHPLTGEPLASVTRKSQAEANMIFSTAYLNLLASGKVRPFMALGGGVALIKLTTDTTTFVHPGLAEIIGYQFRFENLDTDGRRSEAVYKIKPTAEGLAGVNIFYGAHLMTSFSGGYKSGAVYNVHFGFVF